MLISWYPVKTWRYFVQTPESCFSPTSQPLCVRGELRGGGGDAYLNGSGQR